MQDYEFDIIHHPGIQQSHVDCLSRLVRAITAGDFENSGFLEPILSRYNIQEAQRSDSGLSKLIIALENDETIEPFFLDNDGILFRKDSSELSSWRREVFEQIMVPANFINKIL